MGSDINERDARIKMAGAKDLRGHTTPADAVEMAVEYLTVAATPNGHRNSLVGVEPRHIRTLLTALREAQQQNSEQALNIVTMTHMHDALRKSVEMQAEEIKRLRGTILRYLDPVDMSVGSVRDLLDAVKGGGR